MMLELDPCTQMAIRLRAIKNGISTGEVVRRAVEMTCKEDVEEAGEVLKKQIKENPK